MLGVRRTSVSIVANTLQQAGLIKYKRGNIRVLNLEGLRESACECYACKVALIVSSVLSPDLNGASVSHPLGVAFVAADRSVHGLTDASLIRRRTLGSAKRPSRPRGGEASIANTPVLLVSLW